MKVKYNVCFEFDTTPPVTHRGTVSASNAATCFARAARDAMKAHPGLKWSSMLVLLLERLDEDKQESPEVTKTVTIEA